MILGHHGRPTRISECRERCGAGRDGTTARAIVQAARSYGLEAKGFGCTPGALAELPLPAIAHWGFNHFVVLEAITKDGAVIVDPALGRRFIDAADLDASFTGVVLTFRPGAAFERRPAAPGFSWTAYVAALCRRRAGLVGQVLGASVLLQAFGLAIPLFTALLVDRLLPGHLLRGVHLAAAGTALFVICHAFLGYLRARVLLALQSNLDASLMLGFFEHLLSLPFPFFQQRSTGDLLARVSGNAAVREAITGNLLSTVLDGALVVAYGGLLLAWSPSFAGFALGAAALQTAVIVGLRERAQHLVKREIASQADSQAYLVEALRGISLIKSGGTEQRAVARWSDLFFRNLRVSLERGELSALTEGILSAATALATVALLWRGACDAIDGRLSLGAALALSTVATSLLSPWAAILQSSQKLSLLGAELERIGDTLETRPEQADGASRRAPRLRGAMTLEGVRFRFDSLGEDVLRDVSLAVAPGEIVAIVGRTGSGKSTLGQLLLGLYTPTGGRVLYDGEPLTELDIRAVRAQIGVVAQESFLFNGSVRSNIAFGDPGRTLDEVTEAARVACIHEDVERMPMGYETLVGEGGASLSGGQRQRLSIARAVLASPRILLLDEATSHLDEATEESVLANLAALGCTQIMITHRPSTVRRAHRVLLLEGGRLVDARPAPAPPREMTAG